MLNRIDRVTHFYMQKSRDHFLFAVKLADFECEHEHILLLESRCSIYHDTEQERKNEVWIQSNHCVFC